MRNTKEESRKEYSVPKGKEYCYRCGKRLDAYEKKMCDGLCSFCLQVKERIEKE